MSASTPSDDPVAASLESLSTSISSLNQALSPLLSQPHSTLTSSLPLLDKAKLHILTTYAIESLLFSALTLSGVDAKEHPVYRELTRVRQYFDKIKEAEEAGGSDGKDGEGRMRVDKDAAGRMIKAGLSGNERHDRERAVRLGREQQRGREKVEQMGREMAARGGEQKGKRKRKSEGADGQPEPETSEDASQDGRKKDEEKKSKSKKARLSGEGEAAQLEQTKEQAEEEDGQETKEPKSEKRSKKVKKSKSDKVKSNVPPKSAHDVFKGLLKGSKGSKET